MTELSVVYRQPLTGERLRLSTVWAKCLPLPLLERLSEHLPPRLLWQHQLRCGDQLAMLAVLAGRGEQGAIVDNGAPNVYSCRFPDLQQQRQNHLRGRALVLGLVRRALPELIHQLSLFGDRLTVALAVPAWERAYWLMGMEPAARSILVLLGRHELGGKISSAGIAVRYCEYSLGRVDAHLLIVSPAVWPEVECLAVRQGTVIISTDGQPLSPAVGCCSVAWNLGDQLGLPATIWADRQDELPVLEQLVLHSYLHTHLADWSVRQAKQIICMDQAIAWSDWPISHRLK